jgi:ectoine hydroxylase-related dioxygenase (phytanoyl-CoA dioxygenase family)
MSGPPVERLASGVSAEQLVAALGRDGCAIVEGLADPKTLQRLNDDLDSLIAATAPGVRYADPELDEPVGKRGALSQSHGSEQPKDASIDELNTYVSDFYGSDTVRIDGLPYKSASFVEFMCHPLILAATDHFLLPNCHHYTLNTGQLIEIRPGETQQEIHRDDDAWFHYRPPHPELSLQALLALSEFSAESGATQVVPGSHQWDRDRKPKAEEVAICEMSAGSVICYLGSTLHGGGANATTDQCRRGMLAAYCLGWLRTEENTFLSTPIEAVRQMPRLAQELLGYEAHLGIGVVDVASPMRLLRQGGGEVTDDTAQ